MAGKEEVAFRKEFALAIPAADNFQLLYQKTIGVVDDKIKRRGAAKALLYHLHFEDYDVGDKLSFQCHYRVKNAVMSYKKKNSFTLCTVSCKEKIIGNKKFRIVVHHKEKKRRLLSNEKVVSSSSRLMANSILIQGQEYLLLVFMKGSERDFQELKKKEVSLREQSNWHGVCLQPFSGKDPLEQPFLENDTKKTRKKEILVASLPDVKPLMLAELLSYFEENILKVAEKREVVNCIYRKRIHHAFGSFLGEERCRGFEIEPAKDDLVEGNVLKKEEEAQERLWKKPKLEESKGSSDTEREEPMMKTESQLQFIKEESKVEESAHATFDFVTMPKLESPDEFAFDTTGGKLEEEVERQLNSGGIDIGVDEFFCF
eukprot:g78007.t1